MRRTWQQKQRKDGMCTMCTEEAVVVLHSQGGTVFSKKSMAHCKVHRSWHKRYRRDNP